MIRHLFRLVWNRRRANVLIGVEILLSFIVLAVVATFTVYLLDNYRTPLGFDYKDVWSVRVTMHAPEAEQAGSALPPEQTPAGQRARIARLLGLVRDLPGVAAATAAMDAPYGSSSWTSAVNVGGKTYDFGANEADDRFADTMRLRLVRGRWFGPADDGAAWRPTVINQRMARELFAGRDPVGRVIEEDPPREAGGPPRMPMRVVGVISDFRKDGELKPAVSYGFHRNNLDASYTGSRVPRWLLVRVRPGTSAAFEEALVHRLQQGEPAWSFRAAPLSLSRSTVLRGSLPGLTASFLVAFFLLLMVMLGLTGVLWQTVTQRTREIGLRRAKGASIARIRRQILGEVLVLTTLAVALGIVIAAQIPALDLLGAVRPGVYAAGLALSVVCIYLLSMACAWAPSRLATSVPPAEALRYE
jgi:putative ABC transport system permease protein